MEDIETHPHAAFIPGNARVIIIGSFPGRDQTMRPVTENDWFYGTKRNQFWKIISGVYETELPGRAAKEALFKKQGIAIADIFLKIKRKDNNNMDSNLEVIEFNDKELLAVVNNVNIKRILFTSRFVEKIFRQLFPAVTIGECLPSPSPRYARMSLQEKINYYKLKLPAK